MLRQHASSAGGSPAPPPLAKNSLYEERGRKRIGSDTSPARSVPSQPRVVSSKLRKDAAQRALSVQTTKPVSVVEKECGTPLPSQDYGFSSFRHYFSWLDRETGRLRRSTLTRYQIRRVDFEPEPFGAACFRTTYKTFDPRHLVWYTTAAIFTDEEKVSPSPGSPVRRAKAIDELDGFAFHLPPLYSPKRPASSRHALFSSR